VEDDRYYKILHKLPLKYNYTVTDKNISASPRAVQKSRSRDERMGKMVLER